MSGSPEVTAVTGPGNEAEAQVLPELTAVSALSPTTSAEVPPQTAG